MWGCGGVGVCVRGGVYLGKAGGAQGSSCCYIEEIMAPGQVKAIPLLLPVPAPSHFYRSVDKLDRFLLILSLIYKARKEVFLNTKAK